MASVTLTIPEENLLEVIKIIRAGLENSPKTKKIVVKQLSKWCVESEEYITSGNDEKEG